MAQLIVIRKCQMTFEQWFYEQENFGLRAERFHDELEAWRDGKLPTMFVVNWLRAAYNVGYDHRNEELLDDGK